jgi:hypothetical protein
MKKVLLIIFIISAHLYLSAQSITTTFAGGNGHDGNMIDFTAIGSSNVTIDSLDFNISGTAGTDAYVLVYYKAGSYVGFETNPAAWTRLDSVHVLSAGDGNPTRVNIGGLIIPAGQTYGLYLTTHSNGPDVSYTDGANTYSVANVSITAGVGIAYPFASVYNPRTWNGTVYYSLNNCTTPSFNPTTPVFCEGDAASISMTGSSGFYNWYSDPTADTLINTTNSYNFTAQNSAIYYADALCPTSDTAMMDVGTQTSTYSPDSRGFWFTAPSDFVITGLRVPTDITGDQTIEVIRFTNGAPPLYASTTNDFVSLGYWQGVSGTGVIPANIIVHTGDMIGIVGVRGSTTSYNSAPYSTSIDGNAVSLYRLGMQYDLSTQQLHDVFSSASSYIGRVEMYYRAGDASTVTNVAVTVNPTSFTTTNDVICSNDSVLIGGVWQNTTGIYYDTLTNIHFCDSVVELNLTVNPTSFTASTDVICSNDSVQFAGTWYNTTGVYYDTLANIHFCDSVVELDLTVNPANLITEVEEICQGDSLFAAGAWQTTTGLYYDTLTNIYLCDSIIETDLTVHANPVINLGLDTMICDNESILLDAGIFSSYLWSQGDTNQTLLVDTANFIIGANQISIIVTDANSCIGKDTIVITIDDCSGIEEKTNLDIAQIYPNPVTDKLYIEFSKLNKEKMTFSLISLEGKIILMQEITELKTTVDFSYLPKGIYLLRFNTATQSEIYKIVHE